MGVKTDSANRSEIEIADLGDLAVFAAAVSAQTLPGHMIGLSGPLGVGKSEFARALITSRANAMGVEPPREVPSPTFTLVQPYQLGSEALSHFDLYRLNGPDDVLELGFDDALDGGPVLVEWPDRLAHLIPQNRLDLTFAFGEQDTARTVTLVGHGDWVGRTAAVLANFNR
jgi:tRNA threonylcarbamoyladenosine biosynthesis protein TsaE